MLSPRPGGERGPRKPARGDAEALSPKGEERSFAPADEAALETPGPGAGGWEPLSIESFIRLPDTELKVDAPAREASLEPAAAKRALVVIPALNEAPIIEKVIARILDDDHLVDPLVLVADGGSTDGTREIVRDIAIHDRRVRLVDNPGRLQSAGMNQAVRALAGDRPWVVRVDAHADYPRNYVSTLVSEALRTGAASVVVSMDTVGEDWFQRAVAAAQNSVLGTGGSAHRLASEGQWVDHGHHALFRRESYEAIGGYDESFSHNEDAELDLRLAKQGGRIWLTDKLRIGYHPRNTPGALARQYFNYGKGRARTVLKHHTALKIRQAVPLAIAPAVASLLLAPFFWAFAIPALLWACAAIGFGLVLGVRQRDSAAAFAGPAAMIMHLAWSAGFWVQLVRGEPLPKIVPPARGA
ncbi:glycosyltransferase family 2 protein [Phenylobacterium deserti]|uniref:Succinoglycan biosynthesis protein exoa n=1 Tax=Phenylobacterium deserti TaxID=1914756 RepID=A0A328A863_9CAUL|nr:glycosyltransferase family 2 protein [Phenylobacterium deserti]RAK50700.1 succinoglycan biosynthesis protein exoa [Phenylobacterium deserti]